MSKLTDTQRLALLAISKDPGCYSKCENDGLLLRLASWGLIRTIDTGGYEITDAGLSELSRATKGGRE